MQNLGERFLLTLWVGCLWAIGYLAVPVLFAKLDDRMLAGMLAGEMFTIVSYLGLFCGTALLLGLLFRLGTSAVRDWRLWLLLAMLLLVVAGEFILQPQMAELKLAGLPEGSMEASRFARLHGVSSILYLLNSLFGLVLISQPSR